MGQSPPPLPSHHHSHHHHHHDYHVHSSSPILPNQIDHRQFTLLCPPPLYYHLWQPPYFHQQERVQDRIQGRIQGHHN